jgi:hypothetical protein
MQDPRAKTKAALPPPPAGTEDLALIDAPGCAAIGSVGISWWLEEVRASRAPPPAIRAPRFTRWLLRDVRECWAKRIAAGGGDAAQVVIEKAKKASKAAQKKRAQAQQPKNQRARAAKKATTLEAA